MRFGVGTKASSRKSLDMSGSRPDDDLHNRKEQMSTTWPFNNTKLSLRPAVTEVEVPMDDLNVITPDPSWKLVSKDQKVGIGDHFYIVRDLYETPEGKKVSVALRAVERIQG